MFKSWKKRGNIFAAVRGFGSDLSLLPEPLESRRLLSGSPGGFGHHHGHSDHGTGPGGSTITFNLAPAAVQTGLDSLATADGLTDPASTAVVTLGNSDGVETYSVTIDGTGTVSKLTVDPLGDAVNTASHTTTTFATLSSTDSAASTEITTIATALNLSAPATTATVNVTNSSAGVVSYSVHLNSSSTTTTDFDFGTTVTVDAAGDPSGGQQLPFSVFSATIQTALNAHAPTGATALASTSTQNVDVRTTDGVTTYSTNFDVTGVSTTVTVDAAGTPTSLPATTTTTFANLSSGLQTELQTLATADGVTTAIASTQTIDVLTETNGTVIYAASLTATGTETSTDTSTSTYTFNVTIAVDADGNPTTLPNGGRAGFGGDFGGGFPGGFFGGGGGAGDCGSGVGTNSSSGATTANSSNGSSSVSVSSAAEVASATASSGTYQVTAKVVAGVTGGFGQTAGYYVEFTPVTVNAAVATDVTTIQTAEKTLVTDTAALSAAGKKTLKADTKALAAAIKSINSSLTSYERTLKDDAATWAATIKSDLKTIAKDRKNSSALATAETQLAADKLSGLAAVATDESAIETAINANTTVAAARTKLATDLPTIATDESAVIADQSQLAADIEAAAA